MKILLTSILLASLLSIGCSHNKKHSHKNHKKHWQMMDVDNDGAVSKDEFNKAHIKKFEKMDANSDGKVTKEEKRAFMKEMKSCNKRDKKMKNKSEMKSEKKSKKKSN